MKPKDMDNNLQRRFRSILPHEALPTNEQLGYVHIQGAFVPKLVKVVSKQNKTTDEVEDEKNAENNLIPNIDSLLSIMKDVFQGKNNNINDDDDNESRMILQKLPNTDLLSIEIDDLSSSISQHNQEQPLFTKARLCYPSPSIARDIVSFIRSYKITPAILFGTAHTSSSNNNQYHVQYSSKVLQVTQVTQNPLPPTSISWPKVGPPKFRRLLPTQKQNDGDKLQQERSTTRFLFMTNIIDESSTVSIHSHSHSSSSNQSCENVALSDYDHVFNPHLVQDAIRNALQPYCISKESKKHPLEIFLMPKAQSNASFKYIHIGTRSNQDVQVLIETLQGKSIDLHIDSTKEDGCKKIITTGKLFLDHAAITQRCEAKLNLKDGEKGEPTRPECTSLTESVHVPGLVLVPDFLTVDEEETILAVLKGPDAPWAPSQSNFSKTGSVKRRVQHYGYVFDYESADVLRDRDADGGKGCCPPLPSLPDDASSTWSLDKLKDFTDSAVNDGRGWDTLAATIERVRRYEFIIPDTEKNTYNSGTTVRFQSLNQLTVNEYKRGEGIGSHIDTQSAFSDGLISISLGADCVMEFKEQKTGEKKLVHLPPRSMLLMSGPARYSWEHMIVSRGTDFVNGKLIPRKTRTSLTLRCAITLPDINGEVHPLNIVESNNFPPRWERNEDDNASAITTPLTEKQHVHAVYDAIAKQWHHTRGKRGVLWPGATTFLKSLPRGSVVADVGCGDGKYFPAIWQAGSYVIGTDISLPLLETSVGACQHEGEQGPEIRQVSKQNSSFNRRPSVAVADCMNVPLRTGSCDAAICIAVMHHLSTRPRRIRCLKELARIVKKGGTVNVQAWVSSGY